MREITNVVFVCLANQNRSPIAEDVFKDVLR
jgi:protein-tyrosine-phosphatase